MLTKTVLLYVALGVVPKLALAQEVQVGTPTGNVCAGLTRFTPGQTVVTAEEVVAAISTYLRGGANPADDDCAGIAFSLRAAVLSVSGHLTESEHDAQRSLDILTRSHTSDDLILLRPLHTLAVVRFELGKMTLARQASRRMQLIRTERPEDRAIVHTLSATLLRASGRLKEAESEYRVAIGMLHAAGRSQSADIASAWNALALSYIEDRQYDEARQALDHEMAILNTAKDVVAMDRVGLLAARGALHFRQHQWLDAEKDLREALAIADREKLLYPELAVKLLLDYASVLRKIHRRSETRSIEARAASFRGSRAANSVVDVNDLSTGSKLGRDE